MKLSSCLPFKLYNPFRNWKQHNQVAVTNTASDSAQSRSNSQASVESMLRFSCSDEDAYGSDLRELFDLNKEVNEMVSVYHSDRQECVDISHNIDIQNKKEMAVKFASYLTQTDEYRSWFHDTNRLGKSNSTRIITPLLSTTSAVSISSESVDFRNGFRPFTILKTEKNDFILLINTDKKGVSKTNIGKGSYARVRLGYSVTHKKFVAVKKQFKNLEYANNEYDIVSKLSDIYVDRTVTTNKKGRRTSYLYTDVMDFDFFDYLGKNCVTFSREDAIEKITYFKLFVDKLVLIHELNIVHRDIKPDNFLISKESVNIVDFGLSSIGSKYGSGGTIQFMAPEVYSGELSGMPSDIWSMGCVFYDILTGEMVPKKDPHSDHSPSVFIFEEYSYAQKEAHVKQLGKRNHSCLNYFTDADREFLIQLLLRCLEHTPSTRITAVELSTELDQFLSQTSAYA